MTSLRTNPWTAARGKMTYSGGLWRYSVALMNGEVVFEGAGDDLASLYRVCRDDVAVARRIDGQGNLLVVAL